MSVWSSMRALNSNLISNWIVSILLDAEAQKPKGAGIREPKIRDEWLSRWGIMGNSPLSEGMASRGNSEEDRFRPDERGSWLSTLLLCVGSGSASKSSTRWGESSKGRGGAGEVSRGKTANGGEMGEKGEEGGGKEKEGCQRVRKEKERVAKEMWRKMCDFTVCALIWHIQCNQVIADAVFICHAWLCAYIYIWSYSHLCSDF